MSNKVLIHIIGGLAEVMEKPKNVEVEIRDYDSDGAAPEELGEDRAIVQTHYAEPSAAPELLEAARNLLVNARDLGECFDDDGEMYGDYATLDAAVDKAEGK